MDTATEQTTEQVVLVALADIDAGANDRTTFDVADLAESLKAEGQVVPVILRRRATGGYEIVGGERRCRAAASIGWSHVSAIVRELDDPKAEAVMLVENTGRSDLDPIDEARAYRRRMDRRGFTVTEMARSAGVSPAQVGLRLKLLDLVDEAQQLTRTGALPIGFGPCLSGLDANRQRLALRAWAEASGSLNWWAWTALCQRLRNEQDADPMFDADNFLTVAEFVADAGKTTTPTGTLRSLVARMAAVLEAANLSPELVAEARKTLPKRAS